MFYQSVLNHGGDPSVEEVQNPVMRPFETDAQFVDPIAQTVRLRPSQFVPQFAESLQSHVALLLRLGR